MSSPSVPPVSRMPADRTFVVAVVILSLAAVAQLVAVVAALAPEIRLTAATPAPVRQDGGAVAGSTPSVEAMQKANAFMNEAQEFREKGNFRGAFEAMSEADRLVPNKPGILIQMAADQHALGQQPDVIATLRRILALPPSNDPADAPFIEQARSALAQFGVNPDAPASLANPGAGAEGAAATPAAQATRGSDANSAGMRDDVGIPIGSVMGIINAEMGDAGPGLKQLRVATKGASGERIDAQQFVATVDFYERDDQGEIRQAKAQMTEWLSLPATWENGEPEIFQTRYRLPPADRGDLPPLQYHGYVVAIYYKGELQDSRAEPVSLLEQFSPPLTKTPESKLE